MENLDSEVKIYKFDPSAIRIKGSIKSIDENLIKRQLRALRKYCPRAYKDFLFRFTEQDLKKKDGEYEENLLTGEDFKFVYGQIKVKYTVKNGIRILTTFEPQNFLQEGYYKELHQHRGLFYSTQEDIKKIDFYRKLQEKRG